MTREQFVEQVGREQAHLRRFLTALCCGNGAEADDIAQEALIKPTSAAVNMTNVDSSRLGL